MIIKTYIEYESTLELHMSVRNSHPKFKNRTNKYLNNLDEVKTWVDMENKSQDNEDFELKLSKYKKFRKRVYIHKPRLPEQKSYPINDNELKMGFFLSDEGQLSKINYVGSITNE